MSNYLDNETQLPSRSTAHSEVSAPSEIQHTSEYSSKAVETNASHNLEKPSYDDINWDLFPGFQVPYHSKLSHQAWVWTQMYEIEETITGIKYAICKHCIKSRPRQKGNGYIWKDGSTKHIIEHLEKHHNLIEKGPL
jgi:hypothetical protein